MVGAECVPFGADISAEECAARGLKGFEGEDSVWLVSGVRPFVARFCTPACEPWLKTEEAALVSELAEPTPCSKSPESERCSSSVSGERYCLRVLEGPVGMWELADALALLAIFARFEASCARRELV